MVALLYALALFAAAIVPAAAQSTDVPRLQTNQAYIEEVARPTTLSIPDPIAMFVFLLNSLPDRERSTRRRTTITSASYTMADASQEISGLTQVTGTKAR